jgi:hypothetical protein|nr:hypothetical protein [Burkholderiaceae bacterium]
MDTLDTQTWSLLVALAIIALVALAAWLFYRKHQSQRLRQRFGPEYDRTVTALGDRDKAEADLKRREKRVERLHIVALSPAEAARFSQSWTALQGRFVDNPQGVLAEADRLVRELMERRGYPMADFERRAADISVDHPTVVGHYRAARAIALRDEHGEADTEDLRKAVVHYRALFEELCEVEEPTRTPPARPAHP